jgi:hypothetical protein
VTHSDKVKETIRKSQEARRKSGPARTARTKELHKKYGNKTIVPKTTEKIEAIKKDIAAERRKLAVSSLIVVNKRAAYTSKKPGDQITIKEAEFCLKALAETEYSGRRLEVPQMVVNIKDSASLNIQQNFADINEILNRGDIDIDKLVEASGDRSGEEEVIDV